MSKPILRTLLFVLWFSAAIGHMAQGQSIEPLTHPNHYIVLIDASGSTVGTKGARELYDEVLTRRLLACLYQDGFGQAIPPYEPQQDYLTLHHFGVVTGPVETAYDRLQEYDLLADFIHPLFVREMEVEEARLRARLFPTQTYQYTILTWAKQLALHHSRSDSSKSISHRTFMIMVHDGHPNDYSIKGEMEMVRRGARAKYGQVETLVSAIDRDYQFTDGRGNPKPAWTEEIPSSVSAEAPRFFIEVYEVISAVQAEWEIQGLGLRSLDDLHFRWDKETGESPQGVLTAKLGEEFVAWVESAEDSKVSLAAGPDGQLGAGSGLETLVFFREALTCEPLKFDSLLNVRLQRSDRLLGTRIVNYTHRQTVAAPPPMRCTAAFFVSAGFATVLGTLVLLALAYYFYYRFRATHLEIEIPGTLAPIRLERRGQREGRAPVVPQSGLEALSLKLPNWLKQWVFYRGAIITLLSNDGEELLRWSNEEGVAQIKLPLAQRQVLACWRRLPAKPTMVTIGFGQRNQRANVDLIYPRALAESVIRSDIMDENTVFVALDLGSESMAAYYEDMEGNGGMIKLQAQAEALSGISVGELDLLMEDAGDTNKRSPRLWNRISFRHKAQPKELKDDHALLNFVGFPHVYETSLFRFFHKEEAWPPSGDVMPNPKILFQQRAKDILDSIIIEATDGDRVNLNPELLVKHLTLQILINFVLNSPELNSYNRGDIHLIITVPNVYSLPHAESIKEFVRNNVQDVADVKVLSESDAVAYFALKTINEDKDWPELKRFKKAWAGELERNGEFCIVTIDIGKGTTDLSCVLVNEPSSKGLGVWNRLFGRSDEGNKRDNRRRHSVQGKTGKTSGGTYLNYIFACYYDSCLKEVVKRNSLVGEQSLPFGFITKPLNPRFHYPQLKAASKLEKLIERVKQSMMENYEIDENGLKPEEQGELLNLVVDEILNGVDPNWENSKDKQHYEDFRNRTVEALLFPSKLELSTSAKLLAWIREKLGQEAESSIGVRPSPVTAELKRELDKYVRENVDELMESLKYLVREHQAISTDKGNIDSNTFVVISGQASQFRPLRDALKRMCKDLGIGDTQILMMEGVASKEACCRGAINFWKANLLQTNPRELQGTYGCLDAVVPDRFQAFEMKKNKNDGSKNESYTISFKVPGLYYVIFTPRSYEETQERPPRLGDGATAQIGSFFEQSEFTLEYDPDNLELKVNGKKLTISGFGSSDSSIYKKVWPEILEPQKKD